MVVEGGVVSSLSEQLAEARDLREAEVVVRTAVAALGIRSCDVVLPCEGEPERPAGLAFQVVGPRGVVATLVCSSETPLTRECERELVIIAMQLSVWWTNRGIDGTVLTPRQLEVAELASIGRSNAEIADALEISINTVKARLKEVFERLHVDNRTELTSALRARSSR